MNTIPVVNYRFLWILCTIACLFAGSTAVYGAEISDFVMNTDQGYLLLSVKSGLHFLAGLESRLRQGLRKAGPASFQAAQTLKTQSFER